MEKRYKMPSAKMVSLAPGYGGCIASDMITVEGRQVGYGYREEPFDAVDSGWRFLAGIESQEYVEDPDNFSVWEVNQIANYDPEILPFLSAPVGAKFERNDAGNLELITAPERHDPRN